MSTVAFCSRIKLIFFLKVKEIVIKLNLLTVIFWFDQAKQTLDELITYSLPLSVVTDKLSIPKTREKSNKIILRAIFYQQLL